MLVMRINSLSSKSTHLFYQHEFKTFKVQVIGVFFDKFYNFVLVFRSMFKSWSFGGKVCFCWQMTFSALTADMETSFIAQCKSCRVSGLAFTKIKVHRFEVIMLTRFTLVPTWYWLLLIKIKHSSLMLF